MPQDEVERFFPDQSRILSGMRVSRRGEYVRYSDYAALLARAEAAEAERDRQYDENVHRIMMEAAAHARGREEGLREASRCADVFDGPVSKSQFVNGQATAAQQIRAAILALIEKPDGG